MLISEEMRCEEIPARPTVATHQLALEIYVPVKRHRKRIPGFQTNLSNEKLSTDTYENFISNLNNIEL